VPFQSLTKNLKKNFRKILSTVKYGDEQRFPLVYLETYTTKPSCYYSLPNDTMDEPLASYKYFPKLSEEILVSFFSSIGVHYVPEIVLYELAIKTPKMAFEDFCITFGRDDNEMIDSSILNKSIALLMEMDRLRLDKLFDSRPIYRALAYQNLEEAGRLITEMKQIKIKNKNKDK
jgi:hypothetical protein